MMHGQTYIKFIAFKYICVLSRHKSSVWSNDWQF